MARTRVAIVAGVLALAAVLSCCLWRASAATAGAIHHVSIESMKYSPAVLQVRRGEVVVFKNLDITPHSVTSKPPGTFDSDILRSGDSWSWVAREEGTQHYACKFHPTMEGSIVVGKE